MSCWQSAGAPSVLRVPHHLVHRVARAHIEARNLAARDVLDAHGELVAVALLRARDVDDRTLAHARVAEQLQSCSQSLPWRSRVVGGVARRPATRCDAPLASTNAWNSWATLASDRVLTVRSGMKGACIETESAWRSTERPRAALCALRCGRLLLCECALLLAAERRQLAPKIPHLYRLRLVAAKVLLIREHGALAAAELLRLVVERYIRRVVQYAATERAAILRIRCGIEHVLPPKGVDNRRRGEKRVVVIVREDLERDKLLVGGARRTHAPCRPTASADSA